jgi:hypothetical protein
MMHTKDGKEMDMRETQVVEYTTLNICSDEWIVADEQNCPELGGEATFSFSDAYKYLKRDLKASRKGWNGKEQYIMYIDSYMNDKFKVMECLDIPGNLYSFIAI